MAEKPAWEDAPQSEASWELGGCHYSGPAGIKLGDKVWEDFSCFTNRGKAVKFMSRFESSPTVCDRKKAEDGVTHSQRDQKSGHHISLQFKM